MAFVRAISISEVPPGVVREIRIAEKTIALANIEGSFYAISNRCLHRGGPLGQGPLNGTTLTCPWHGWGYNMTTGKVNHNQAVGVACYPVEVRDQDVFINVD